MPPMTRRARKLLELEAKRAEAQARASGTLGTIDEDPSSDPSELPAGHGSDSTSLSSPILLTGPGVPGDLLTRTYQPLKAHATLSNVSPTPPRARERYQQDPQLLMSVVRKRGLDRTYTPQTLTEKAPDPNLLNAPPRRLAGIPEAPEDRPSLWEDEQQQTQPVEQEEVFMGETQGEVQTQPANDELFGIPDGIDLDALWELCKHDLAAVGPPSEEEREWWTSSGWDAIFGDMGTTEYGATQTVQVPENQRLGRRDTSLVQEDFVRMIHEMAQSEKK